MEKRARELLDTLSIRIPSVRIPVAALSGGQRQVVAIARALIGDPKVVILDEPTAALGVEQTAQVLDLVERLRERGLAVILISHNMADVKAVADRVAVLRLGRNNGSFSVKDTSQEEIIAAITGATDNAVTRRAGRRSTEAAEVSDTSKTSKAAAETQTVAAATDDPTAAADRHRVDPRLLVREEGFEGYRTEFKRKVKGGELGSLPVVVGLIVICDRSSSCRTTASSAPTTSRTSATTCRPPACIAIGIVFVLLLGEIDLSVGSVSGLASTAVRACSCVTPRHERLAVAGPRHPHRYRHRRAARLLLRQDRRARLRRHPGRLPRLERPDALAAGLQRHHQHPVRLRSGRTCSARARSSWTRPSSAPTCWPASVSVLMLVGNFSEQRRRKAAGVPFRPTSEILVRVGALAIASFVAAAVLNNASGVSTRW